MRVAHVHDGTVVVSVSSSHVSNDGYDRVAMDTTLRNASSDITMAEKVETVTVEVAGSEQM